MFLRRESFKQYVAWYPVTAVLIALNIIMFLVLEISGSSRSPETLIQWGAMYHVPGYATEWWRFFTAMFLHIGWEHLLFNCFALLVFAPPLERIVGKPRYITLYLIAGVFGNMFSYLVHSDLYFGAGASGAIYGVYAGYIFIALFRKDMLDEPSLKTIRIIVVIGFLHSLIVPGIDLWAHLGGFIGGMIMMGLFVLWIRRRRA